MILSRMTLAAALRFILLAWLVLGAVRVGDVSRVAPGTFAVRAMLLVEGAKFPAVSDASDRFCGIAWIILVFESHHTLRSCRRAPGATAAAAAALHRAGRVFGDVRAGAAGVVLLEPTVAANAIELLSGYILRHFATMRILSHHEMRVPASTAPFTITTSASGLIFAARWILGRARGVGRGALARGVRRADDALALAPGATAARAVVLLGALASVGCNGHGIASATEVLLVLATEAAGATLL
mmetsp:Transcript_18400/g.30209  ORF Transcript_18400/g.30209 Transcript_18400/m.30209 type:complete len:242 (-) Transcript_18400:346-1071(-)